MCSLTRILQKGLDIQNKKKSGIHAHGFGIIRRKNTPTPHPSPHHTARNWTLTETSRNFPKMFEFEPNEETKQKIKVQSVLNEVPEKAKTDEEKESMKP